MKNHTARFVMLVSFFFTPYFCKCQQNFIPAKIISTTGDTVSGMLDYRNWPNNPKSIKFIANGETEAKEYKPLNIRSFFCNNEIYVGALINYETSSTETIRLSLNSEPELRQDTTFLQTLILGPKKSLFVHVNQKGRKNFFIDQDGKFELLFYKKYLTDSRQDKLVQLKREKLSRIENKRFINQLKLYFSDCPQILKKTTRIKYKTEELKKLFDQYYNCTNSNVTYRKNKDKFKFRPGVIAGISYTNLRFGGYAVPHLTQTDFKPSVNPAAGITLDIIFPRYNGKLSLYNELFYSTYKTSGNYENIISDDEYLKIYSEFGFNYLKMNNMVRYNYPVGSFKLFASVGLSNGYGFVRSNFEVRESKYFSRLSVDKADALYSIRRYEQGYLLSLGTIYDRYILEMRMEKGNGMSNFPILGSAVRRLSLLIGYTF